MAAKVKGINAFANPAVFALSIAMSMGCTTKYYVKWFDYVDAENLCGDNRECRAGGAGQQYKIYTNDAPPLTDLPETMIGRLVNVDIFDQSSTCLQRLDGDIKKVEDVAINAELSKSGINKFMLQLGAQLEDELTKNLAEKAKLELKADVYLALKRTLSNLRVTKGKILYQQFALSPRAIDRIRNDLGCQRKAADAAASGTTMKILSNLTIITTSATLGSEIAENLVANLQSVLGLRFKEAFGINSTIGSTYKKQFKQKLAGKATSAALVFSVAYVSPWST